MTPETLEERKIPLKLTLGITSGWTLLRVARVATVDVERGDR